MLLGLVQGILEWLPVSSEGQILFLGTLFGVNDQSLLLSVAFWLHFGTMAAVLILFRKEWSIILDIRNPDGNAMRSFLIYTTIGTAITGIPIKLLLLDLLSGPEFGLIIMLILGIALIITGVMLKVQQASLSGDRLLDQLTVKESLLIGMAQGFTIIPGVSRSGTTVTALLYADLDGDSAFRGSFFMSVPAVLGAIGLDVLDYIRGSSDIIVLSQPIGILIAIAIAAILGIITMKALISFAKNVDFSNIVLVLAAIVLIYTLILLLF